MSWHHTLLRSKPVFYTLTLASIYLVAYILFNAPTVSVDRQKTIQTKTSATALLQAIEGFYSTYTQLPEFGAQGEDSTTEGQAGTRLLTILLGKEELNASIQNKRQIRFLSVEETKIKNKGGLLYTNVGAGATPEGLYDAWGRPFHIRFDTHYKGEIPDPLKAGEIIRGKRLIVYSYGKDGKPGTKDDIKTW